MAATNNTVETAAGGFNKILPAEVLQQIFAFCDVTDLLMAADVCQLWRDVICQRTTAFNVELQNVDNVNDLATLLARARVLQLPAVWKVGVIRRNASPDGLGGRINGQGFGGVTVIDAVIRFEGDVLLPRVHSVRKLSIRECGRSGCADDKRVPLDIAHGHGRPNTESGLESFRLVIKENASQSLVDTFLTLVEETSARTLTHLRLHLHAWRRGATGRKVEQALAACRHLTHLTLYDVGLIGDANTELDVKPMFDADRVFHMFDIDVGVRCVDIIPTLRHLQAVDLRGDGIIPMGLSRIMISSLVVRAGDDFRLLQLFSYIGELILDLDTDHLSTLVTHLYDCSDIHVDMLDVSEDRRHDCNISDDILLSLVQAVRGVRHVFAHECQRITNEGVVSIIKAASATLDEIVVDDIRNISAGLIPLLEGVNIARYVSVSAESTTLSEQMGGMTGKLYLEFITLTY